MKKIFSALAFGFLALAACKKDSPATSSGNNNSNNTPGFTWTENGGSANTADSAFWVAYSGGAGIRAYKGGMASFFEINFANSNAGSQALGANLTMLKGNTVINSTSGTVNIISNTSDKPTGTVTATVSGGGLTAISCTYTSLPKHP